MKIWFLTFAASIWLVLTGCNPPVAQVEERKEPEPEAGAEPEAEAETPPPAVEPPPVVEPTTDPLAVIDSEALKPYLVLNDPWNRYFRSPPRILLVPELSTGIAELLNEEQSLIKAVLDASSEIKATSEYAALEEKIEELKLTIPQAETSSGYVPRGGTRSYTYVSSSGSTAYVRRSSGYYDGYYRIFHRKQKSSSPALVRSVEGIAHNTTLEDLDQRIDALQQIISLWNRKTAGMSVNGTEGIMRRANEDYLEGLRGFTQEYVTIRSELRKIEEKQARVEQEKSAILSEWQEFESNRLPILDEYLNEHTVLTLKPDSKDAYEIPQ
ncbi:MAG: hypothetical protein ACOCVJ_02925, partial [Verrucomicrobiota bacterium]